MSLRQLYRDKIAEVERKGIQQGVIQGIQQEINMLMRQLKRKIGHVSPELEIRVRNIPMEQLEDFGEALLDFNSPEDLADWLDNYCP